MSESAVTTTEQKLGSYEQDRQRWCAMARLSGLVPKSLNSDAKVFIAIEAGREAGFSPLMALKSVYVINGMPSLTGRGTMALIQKSNVCKLPPVVEFGGEGDDYGCTITVQRDNMPKPVKVRFTIADAKRAKLWGKGGPWSEYPDQMLQWRCVGRMADFYFPDVMSGLGVMEVVRDHATISVERERTDEPDPLLLDAGGPREPEIIDPEVDPETGEEIPGYIPGGQE